MASGVPRDPTMVSPGGSPPRLHQVGQQAHPDDVSSIDDGVHEKEHIVPLKKREKVKRHCMRFKWWYLGAIIIFLAILLPILFKVIIPAIIKNIVSGQELPLRAGSLSFVSPTELSLSLDTMLDTPLGVKIDPVFLNLHAPHPETTDSSPDQPFLALQMPELHVNGETEILIPQQNAPVQDMAQLEGWFSDFFDAETTELRVTANDLTAHLGALTYKVDLDKTIRIQGLNGLNGFTVEAMKFKIPADPDTGYNVHGTLNIPNAGVLTLNLGKSLTFDLLVVSPNGQDVVKLGSVHTIEELILQPSSNNSGIPFEGEFFFDQLVPHLGDILASQEGHLQEGRLQLNATGSAVLDGEGRNVEFLENVLSKKRITFYVPVVTLLGEVVSGLLNSEGSADGSTPPLLDVLGDVVGNSTLFETLLQHWDGNEGGGNNNKARDMGVKKLSAKKMKRSIQMDLLRLGLRGFRAKF